MGKRLVVQVFGEDQRLQTIHANILANSFFTSFLSFQITPIRARIFCASFDNSLVSG